MLKKLTVIFSFIVILAVIFFFGFASKLADSKLNIYDKQPSYIYPKFHDSLFIADLHSDFFLWDRDFTQANEYGHTDLPRSIEGNLALQVFGGVTHVPTGANYTRNNNHSDITLPLVIAQGWPFKTWFSPLERALYQANRLIDAAANSQGKLRIIRHRGDLFALHFDRAYQGNLVGGMMSLEGVHALEGKVSNLDALYDAGYRMIGFSHYFDTEFGGSAHGEAQYGLTNNGRQLIAAMERKGMMIDVSHASPKLIDDILAFTDSPLFVSHTGIKGTCDTPRNLSDQQLRKIAATGGLIGIAFFPQVLCGNKIEDLVKAIQYAINIAGVDAIALGSDFEGAVQTPFDIANIAALTDHLLRAGLSQGDVKKIMGDNVLRVFAKTLPANTIQFTPRSEFVF